MGPSKADSAACSEYIILLFGIDSELVHLVVTEASEMTVFYISNSAVIVATNDYSLEVTVAVDFGEFLHLCVSELGRVISALLEEGITVYSWRFA